MISMEMRQYNYLLYGQNDEYGAQQLDEEVKGSILIAIYTNTMATADNIKYSEGDFIGLTSASINDSYVILYGDKKLKVLYTIPARRYTQAFLKEI